VVPATDVALMLGLAHTLVAEGLHDKGFLSRYCSGYDTFEGYLLGQADGVPKDASWAGAVCGIEPDVIRRLARRMASARTLITVTWSLQRAQHGEQPVWAALALAAMLGRSGCPAGASATATARWATSAATARSSGCRPCARAATRSPRSIPVARIADMLLNPGAWYDYNGQRYRYPDIRWSTGPAANPFHHHQDLGRLSSAVGRPDTIVVHEPHWTATARQADIVLRSPPAWSGRTSAAGGATPT